MTRRFVLTWAFFAVLAYQATCCTAASEVEITLDNGEVISGCLLCEDDRSVVLQLPNGQLVLKKSRIVSITKDSPVTEIVTGQRTVPPGTAALAEGASPGTAPETENFAPAGTGAAPAGRFAKEIALVMAEYSRQGDSAAQVLLKHRSEAIGEVLQALEASSEAEPQVRLITLLGQMGDPSISGRLAAIERKPDTPAAVQAAIATALGQLGSPDAVENLSVILDSSAPQARQSAAAAIGRLPNPSPQCLADLVRRLDDPDEWTRSTCQRSLRNLAESDPSGSVTENLLHLMNAASPSARIALATVLYQLNRPEGLATLVRLSESLLPEHRVAAVQALADCRAPEAIAAIVERLQDNDPSVRQAAVVALRWFAQPDLVEALRPLLDDPEPSVRQAARHTITRLLQRPLNVQR